ncbi:MAG: pyrroloquinoline quinone biosynthesis protein PqqB [Marinospirillum sp.]|uniref:pyrroloquinoline quinone biosynthesis protein PqqB n=1 Tax=Marinospirillum sp. TaxID=2183934 RepID=UPI001A0AB3DC|nr:pyrroloquinoline quinone biosynthesis protein PqqB [Marinospirillum sp.]MBE0505626.1 pyrroloquinoline quinone biosynthesis protein PqqB [Marinospirillum sp.]
MQIQILGSAAGGGFPQWNCNCDNCSGVRKGIIQAHPRTQSSIAVSGDGKQWILFNASPDIRAQLESFPPLQPSRGKRDTGIAAIVLIDSQIDHTTGLLMLREGCPHQVWCTAQVHEDLTSGFPVFNMLSHWNGGLEHHTIPIDSPVNRFTIPAAPTLEFFAIALQSSAPPYSPHRNDPHVGDNIGVLIRDTQSGRSLFYAPGLGQHDRALLEVMASADCLLVDGTLWCDDELLLSGVGDKLGVHMGHLPQSGSDGMIALLDAFPNARKILIHINNTNPILREDSAERAELTRHGIEVAHDGMSLTL